MVNQLIRLDVLPYLANLTTDLRTNYSIILQQFDNTFTKRDAFKIINETQPLSCVWGPILSKRLLFLVDVSGSMATTFVDKTGKTYTRLQYVQQDLANVIENVLLPYQEFNVAYFSDNVYQWKNGVVPVNRNNTISAINFVKGFSANGGTNTLGALKAVIADPNLLAVYLLSDGEPNAGQIPSILSIAKQWSSAVSPPKNVNTVCFQLGGTYVPGAADFMQTLAATTGGTFR